SDAATRVLVEARLAGIVRHRNIAEIHDVGTDRGYAFIAMELVQGRTLYELVTTLEQRRRAVPPRLAAAIIAECCTALDHAHALRVVHRDVTARNIMVGYDGEVRLVDF